MSNGEPINQEGLESARPGAAGILAAADMTGNSVWGRLGEKAGDVLRNCRKGAATVAIAAIIAAGCGNIEEPLPVSPYVQESVEQITQETKNTYWELMKKFEEDAKTSGPYFAIAKYPDGTKAFLFPIPTLSKDIFLNQHIRYFLILAPDGPKSAYVRGNSIPDFLEVMRENINSQDKSVSPNRTFGVQDGKLTYTKDGKVVPIGDVLDGIYEDPPGFSFLEQVTNNKRVNDLFAKVIEESKKRPWEQETRKNAESLTQKANTELSTAKGLSEAIDSLLSPTPAPSSTSELAKSAPVQ